MAALATVAAAVLVLATPASAGGSWFDPDQDRYEPGDVVTMVGYTGGGAYGWIEDGPFLGYLVTSDGDGVWDPDGERLAVGQLEVTETGAGGYLTLRASITFTLPDDLEPGIYGFDYCNDGCDERLGDLIGGTLAVGVDPPGPVSREWPIDDPAFHLLADDALLSCPGLQTSAGAIRAGEVEAPDWCWLDRSQVTTEPVDAADGDPSAMTATTTATTTRDETVSPNQMTRDDDPEIAAGPPASADGSSKAGFGPVVPAAFVLAAAIGAAACLAILRGRSSNAALGEARAG